MFYATWSRGFRPGGINRRGDIPPYDADFLTNYELGWKTTFGPLRWNGAIYHQRWKAFQFSFLGENSFTEIHNGKDANINGVETDINYVSGGLTLNAAAAYTDAKTKGNICGEITDTTSDCSLSFVLGADRQPAAGHSEVQGLSDGALQLAGVRRRQGPCPGRARLQGSARRPAQPDAAVGRWLRLRASGIPVLRSQFVARQDQVFGHGRFVRGPRLAAGGTSRLFVTNLFDSTDELSRGINCGSCTRTLIVPGRPRTIGIRAGLKF